LKWGNKNGVGKDRIFTFSSIEELKAAYMELAERAKECSEQIDLVKGHLRDLMYSVPEEAKDIGLEEDILNTAIEIEKFEKLSNKLKYDTEKLLNGIPQVDSKSAERLVELSANARILMDYIDEIQRLISTDFNAKDTENFLGSLKDLQNEYKTRLSTIDESLEDILDKSKGLALEAVEFKGDPINLATGNFSYEKADIEIKGTYPLEFRRTYNAIDDYKGVLGNQWVHNFEVSLIEKDDVIKVMKEDGKVDTYTKEEDQIYKCIIVPGQRLIKTEDEKYRLYLENQTAYNFNEARRLESIVDGQGNKTTLKYNEENQLKEIRTLSGYFRLYYNSKNLLGRINDSSGRRVSFYYEGNNLKRVVLPNKTEFKYKYDNLNRLTVVTSPRNIDLIRNEYDDLSRATKQIFPDGGILSLKHLDDKNQIELTEQNGNKIIYGRDHKFRNTKVIYEDGEEIYDFNDSNKRTSFIDKKGNKTEYEYDSNGNLTRVINPLGEVMKFEYDKLNNLTKITQPNNKSISLKYDNDGNLLKVENPYNERTIFKYDEYGRIIESIQPDNSKLKLSYDEKGNLKSLEFPNGGIVYYEYNENNQVIKTTNPKGHITYYEYDEMNNLKKVINAKGFTREYTYNKIGKVIEIKDFDNTIIKRDYNNLGRVSKIMDQLGQITELEYDLMWNISKIKEPNGAETVYLYNKLNQLTTIRNPLGYETRYKYDPNGNVIETITPKNEKIKITYDELDRRKSIIEEDGVITKYEYNSLGKISKIINSNNEETLFEYDYIGQLVKQVNVLGNETHFTYTPLGNIETVTDALGNVTKYDYYPGGQLKSITLPEGEKEEYKYDLNGNVIEKKMGDKIALKFEYDSLDQIIAIENPLGGRRTFKYNASGYISSLKDENGNITKYEYSPTGNITKVIGAKGNETNYKYDEVGNLTKIEQLGEISPELEEVNKLNEQNNISRITKYQYDLLGNITKIIDGENQEERYTYDENNRMIEKVDKDGYITKMDYSPVSQLETLTYDDGKKVKFQYNALRQLIEIEDWLGKTKISIDSLGRTENIKTPDNKEVKYKWNELGQKEELIYPDGKIINYTYDKSQRLTSIKAKDKVYNYSYDEIGRLIEKTYPNSIVANYNYNNMNQITSLIYKKDIDILEQHEFTYDDVGNRIGTNKIRQGEKDSNYSYSYDGLNRLTKVLENNELIREYKYDAFGNRIEKGEKGLITKYHYNKLDQLIKEELPTEIKTYEYDKRGNRIKEYINQNLNKIYNFDATGMMNKVWNKDIGTAKYKYNGLRNRVGQEIERINKPIEKINYVLDLTLPYNNVLELERNTNLEQYLWDGNLLGTLENEHFLTDELGTPIRSLNIKGNTNNIYSYDEFGIARSNTSTFGFTGYQHDPISELNYAQARYYDQNQGRFISWDPILGMIYVPESINPYSYSMNDPLNKTDKTGLWAVIDDLIVLGVGAGVGIGTQLLTDIIDGEFSSKQAYIGATAGGATGAWTGYYFGPVAGGAAGAGVTTAVTEGLEYLTVDESEKKDFDEITFDVLKDAFVGGVVGKICSLEFKVMDRIKSIKPIDKIASMHKSFSSRYYGELDLIREGELKKISFLTISRGLAVEGIDAVKEEVVTGVIEGAFKEPTETVKLEECIE